MRVLIQFDLDISEIPGIDSDAESAVYDYMNDLTYEIRSSMRVSDYREDY